VGELEKTARCLSLGLPVFRLRTKGARLACRRWRDRPVPETSAMILFPGYAPRAFGSLPTVGAGNPAPDAMIPNIGLRTGNLRRPGYRWGRAPGA